MKKNIRLWSTLSIAVALAGGVVTFNSEQTTLTVQAASITLPAGYTKSAIIKWNQTGKASNLGLTRLVLYTLLIV